MNLITFHEEVDKVWTYIEEQLDAQDADIDTERQGAVFTLHFDDDSQIVINKQEAMLELWLASKLGGFHFAYHDGDWVSSEGRSFWTHLEEAIAHHGEKISFHK
ncbi:iron donor protein CyaY [Otariodibacter oris]|uniref:Iron-sulfur cluster assembly protein CyaY n=1 Tax=Otariodibacter oris TaxID=1032623 RepID=A0A420XEU1_9PAST|nr:iron donor protein CyaY [Otariodibacter oris]QGM81358.1 iron donor protein CyaY [Otariodibacter oris]RKR70830.1 CyaY protein [Otariodibacter oris]